MCSTALGHQSRNVVGIMYWTLSKGILNYTSPAYQEWLLENKVALQNLWNPSYWKSQMTDEEREMRRHPNRSVDWIPNRLTKMRDRVKEEQMTWILGEDGWTKRWNYEGDCYRCGISMKRLKQYQQELLTRVEEMKVDAIQRGVFADTWAISEDDHQEILRQALAEIADSGKYTIHEIERSISRHPESHRHTMMTSQYGFCPDCYTDWVEPQLGWRD